jgi:hypothetical protein
MTLVSPLLSASPSAVLLLKSLCRCVAELLLLIVRLATGRDGLLDICLLLLPLRALKDGCGPANTAIQHRVHTNKECCRAVLLTPLAKLE